MKADTVAWRLKVTPTREVDGIFPFLGGDIIHALSGVQSYKTPTEGEPKRVVNEHNDHKTLFNSLPYCQKNFSKMYSACLHWNHHTIPNL